MGKGIEQALRLLRTKPLGIARFPKHWKRNPMYRAMAAKIYLFTEDGASSFVEFCEMMDTISGLSFEIEESKCRFTEFVAFISPVKSENDISLIEIQLTEERAVKKLNAFYYEAQHACETQLQKDGFYEDPSLDPNDEVVECEGLIESDDELSATYKRQFPVTWRLAQRGYSVEKALSEEFMHIYDRVYEADSE